MGNCIYKRKALQIATLEDHERFILIEDKTTDYHGGYLGKSNNNIKWRIKDALNRSGVFTDEINYHKTSEIDIDKIVNSFVLKTFNKGDVLYKENDYPSKDLFIVNQGAFRGYHGVCSKTFMRQNDMIGELGFFLEAPQLLSIITDENNSSAYCLSKRDYKAIIEKGRDLRNIQSLKSLSDNQKCVLKTKITISNFLKGDSIICNNAPIPALYLILSGSLGINKETSDESPTKLLLSKKSKEDLISTVGDSSDSIIMTPGDYFGEENLLSGCDRGLKSLIAMRETSICIINKELFDNEEVFGSARTQIMIDHAARQNSKGHKTLRRTNSIRKLVMHQMGNQGIRKLQMHVSQKRIPITEDIISTGIFIYEELTSCWCLSDKDTKF